MDRARRTSGKHDRRRAGGWRDLFVIALIAGAVFWLIAATDGFQGTYDRLVERFPGQVDEALALAALLTLAFGAFAGLRWRHAIREGRRSADTEGRLRSLVEVEEKLRTTESMFRSLVEQLPAVMYMDKPETGRNLYISPQIESMFGYTPEEWMADPGLWEQRLHPEDRERVISERQAETGDTSSIDYRAFARDGRVLWIHDESMLVRDQRGNPKYRQGLAFDITERKRAEERLREAEARYRGLVEQLPAVVYVDAVDDMSTALYVSPGYETLLGFTAEERLADPGLWARRLHPQDRDRVLAESRRTNETGDPFRVEYRLIRKDGRVVWVRDEGILHREDSGEPLFWQGVLLDITEQKEAEEGLRHREAILEAVRFAAERFLQTASWREGIEPVLARLGTASGASRAYVFKNHQDDTGALLMSQLFEWVAEGVPSTMDDPENQDFPYRAGGFGRWEEVLGEGGIISGTWSDFPEAEQADMRSEGIRSIAVVPIFVGDEWWGFLGFDECRTERLWPKAETDALKAAADALGAAIRRERGEIRLREAQTQFRTLVEQIPTVTYIDAPDQNNTTGYSTTYVSPQIRDMLGYAPEEFIADPELWPSLLHPDDREHSLAEDAGHYSSGQPFSQEYRLIAKDGRVVWVRNDAVMILDDEGRPVYSQGVIHDITAVKEAQHRLEEAEERFRNLVETIPAVTYVDDVDPHATTLYVSPQIETFFSYTVREWLENADLWLERMAEGTDVDSIRAALERHNETGEPFDVEYRMRTGDGRMVWVRDQARILRHEDGRPRFSQGVMYDITEQKLAEQALLMSERREREAAERLRALDEMKNTFLAAVSHELRSPLTSILGLSLTLEQQELAEGDRTDLLVRLAANARKLDRLLKDLLDVDRLQRGIVMAQERPADIGALARRTVESMDALAERSILVEAQPVVIAVDASKVERIVENLLSNALRHTAQHVRLWVRVAPHEGGALIAVEDDGPGVPEEIKRAIFDPFRQGPTSSSHSPGTGIGLSLVKMFAELHGGRAWVQDREGGGASFRVFLPGKLGEGGRLPAASPNGERTMDAAEAG